MYILFFENYIYYTKALIYINTYTIRAIALILWCVSSWVSSIIADIVRITTATAVTIVHQRLLPCCHHCFCFSDHTTSCPTRKDSFRSTYLWNLVSIGPLMRPHTPLKVLTISSRATTCHHSSSRAAVRFHALTRSKSASANIIDYVIYAISALGDLITATSSSWCHHYHVIQMSTAYIIHKSAAYVILWPAVVD